MKHPIIALASVAFLVSGCSADTYELTEIAKSCGGIEKVHHIWIDAMNVKGYCLDGSRAGEW